MTLKNKEKGRRTNLLQVTHQLQKHRKILCNKINNIDFKISLIKIVMLMFTNGKIVKIVVDKLV